MNQLQRYLPWAIALVGVCCVAKAAWPTADPEEGMQVLEFGQLPVLDHGRVKPFDSVGLQGQMKLPDPRLRLQSFRARSIIKSVP